MKNVKVLEYDGGNVGSIINAFTKIGFPPAIAMTENDILSADLVIFPGVGSAKAAISELEMSGTKNALNERNARKLPTLGICLGAQMLFEYLEEASACGLGWLSGRVNSFRPPMQFNNGWRHLDNNELKACGLARGLSESSTYYFNHQYYFSTDGKHKTVSIKELAGVGAVCLQEHLCGIQFHPEKSQQAGEIVLRNVLRDYYAF